MFKTKQTKNYPKQNVWYHRLDILGSLASHSCCCCCCCSCSSSSGNKLSQSNSYSFTPIILHQSGPIRYDCNIPGGCSIACYTVCRRVCNCKSWRDALFRFPFFLLFCISLPYIRRLFFEVPLAIYGSTGPRHLL